MAAAIISLHSAKRRELGRHGPPVGHGSTTVTEHVYRCEIRPAITHVAEIIDQLFDAD
jgi:hypothetical protein